jgi:hypothetical protein
MLARSGVLGFTRRSDDENIGIVFLLGARLQ